MYVCNSVDSVCSQSILFTHRLTDCKYRLSSSTLWDQECHSYFMLYKSTRYSPNLLNKTKTKISYKQLNTVHQIVFSSFFHDSRIITWNDYSTRVLMSLSTQVILETSLSYQRQAMLLTTKHRTTENMQNKEKQTEHMNETHKHTLN